MNVLLGTTLVNFLHTLFLGVVSDPKTDVEDEIGSDQAVRGESKKTDTREESQETTATTEHDDFRDFLCQAVMAEEKTEQVNTNKESKEELYEKKSKELRESIEIQVKNYVAYCRGPDLLVLLENYGNEKLEMDKRKKK